MDLVASRAARTSTAARPSARRLRLAAAVALVAGAAGCKKAPVVTPAPQVLRPEPRPTAPVAAARTDCDPPQPDAIPPMTYEERKARIPEAQALANQGTDRLKDAEASGLDPQSREEAITDAVATLIAALNADPYNVHATYNLAAAYARIERPLCSLTLLDRLVRMHGHPSRQPEVNQKLDRLLGRNGAPLDADFRGLRQAAGFGCVVGNLGAAQPKDCFSGS